MFYLDHCSKLLWEPPCRWLAIRRLAVAFTVRFVAGVLLHCVSAETSLQKAKRFASLGWSAYHEQDYVQAMNWFRIAADMGSASGQAGIGWLSRNGLGDRRTTLRRCAGFAWPPWAVALGVGASGAEKK